ncbi:MAG: ABC transporter ATP-binding protein [Pirellulales bacterium]|nr:ABC transporter ATP-binding protein [Pirellulales bacterium]
MLRITNLRKSYRDPAGGEMPILEITQFDIPAGGQTVLVGRSGCGKTTLLHTIAGIIRPDAGEVLVDQTDITKLGEAVRDRFRASKIGYVFQTFNLLPAFSALENVLLGMTFSSKGADRARAEELLARVGLGHRLQHKPGQLSVGERQRVAVARALANRPKLLLADEPTANVDTRNQQGVIDLIRECCAQDQVSLLLVTHAPEVASQFERVVNLEELNLAVRPRQATTPTPSAGGVGSGR